MATVHRKIDPVTMDYVLTSGLPEADATSASEIVLRLTTRRGTVRLPGLEEFGSRLREIDRNSSGSDRRAVAFATDALQPMVKRGSITSLVVTAEVQSATGLGAALLLEVSWKEAGAQQPLSISLPI